MKKNILTCLVVLTGTISLFSCSKSDLNPRPANQSNASPDLSTGTWTITTFTQRTEDKTAAFDGFLFTFSTDGTLKAEKSGISTLGTWQHRTPVTYYGVTSPVTSAFAISIGTSTPLILLNRDWNMDSVNTTPSRLALISPEPLENMHVTFSRQ